VKNEKNLLHKEFLSPELFMCIENGKRRKILIKLKGWPETCDRIVYEGSSDRARIEKRDENGNF
jgi:hypothetical protein